ALDIECRGAGQPALSQDAKTGLPGTHAGTDPCTLGAGYVARSPSRRPSTNPRLTSSCTGWINPVTLLQSRVAPGFKQRSRRAIPEIRPEFVREFWEERDIALLAAFGMRDQEHLLVKIHIGHLHMHKLRHPVVYPYLA